MTLDETLAEAWRLLASGAADPKSPFRTVSLGTVALDGTPTQRIVVVRGVDAAQRVVSLHTDSRSAKFAELQARPAVALLAWDPAERLQLRLSGQAALHAGDAHAFAAWDALPPISRQLYRVRQAPGTPVSDPSPSQYGEYPEPAGLAFFTAIEVAVTRVEALRLTNRGQIRARFEWGADGPAATWLVP